MFMKLHLKPSFKKLTHTIFSVFCLALSLTSFQAAGQVKIVIFDVGGVLADTSRSGMMGELGGLTGMIKFMICEGKRPDPKPLLFKLMAQCAGKQVPEMGCACAWGDGAELPQLFCDWMTGKVDGKDVIEIIDQAINTGIYDNLFSGNREKELVRRLAHAIFNPHTLAEHTHPIEGGAKLVRDCAKNPDLQLYVLSNYAKDAFEELAEKCEFQKVFSHIPQSHFVVSGFVGAIKPYKSIYAYVIDAYHIVPEECVFIDDQKENIDAAARMGFNTIHLQNGDYAKVRQELAQLGISLGA